MSTRASVTQAGWDNLFALAGTVCDVSSKDGFYAQPANKAV